MKKLSLTTNAIILVLCFLHPLYAKAQIELNALTGYRNDRLSWNIAGSLAGTAPNVLSELTWQDIHIYEIGILGRILLGKHYLLEGTFLHGWVSSGKTIDSDFLSDNRSDEFSRSVSRLSGTSRSNFFSLSAGYRIPLAERRNFNFAITPLGGYSHDKITLKDTAGVQVVPALGPFSVQGINAIYEPSVHGPWAGAQFTASNEKLGGQFRLEFHRTVYEATADWVLRRDLQHPVSFLHDSHGNETAISGKFFYHFSAPWAVVLNVRYTHRNIGHGTDRTLAANGMTFTTRLNEVNWTSTALQAGIVFKH